MSTVMKLQELKKAKKYLKRGDFEKSMSYLDNYLISIDIEPFDKQLGYAWHEPVDDKKPNNIPYKLRKFSKKFVKYLINKKGIDISPSHFGYDFLNKKMQIVVENFNTMKKLSKCEQEFYNGIWAKQLNEYMLFGKYQNSIVYDVLKVNPDYLIWCIMNSLSFFVDNTAFLFKELREHKYFYEAFEYNLVKDYFIHHYNYNEVPGWAEEENEELEEMDHYNYFSEEIDSEEYSNGPERYGYKSWAEMELYTVWEGNIDLYFQHYNE